MFRLFTLYFIYIWHLRLFKSTPSIEKLFQTSFHQYVYESLYCKNRSLVVPGLDLHTGHTISLWSFGHPYVVFVISFSSIFASVSHLPFTLSLYILESPVIIPETENETHPILFKSHLLILLDWM